MAFKFNPFTGNFDIVKASTGTSVWIKDNQTVSASSSLVYDTVALTAFNHLEYYISYENPTGEVKSLNLSLINDNGSLREKVSGKLGANLDVDITTAVNAGNMELTITNNEVVDVDIATAKLTLL